MHNVQLMFCSCLIARNLLSGLKTCLEVSRYMHEGGVSMPYRSNVGSSSFLDENGKTDTDCTVSIIGFLLLSSLLLLFYLFC